MPKQITKWSEILPGDIISFRYKSTDKSKPVRTHTIMVLNPKFPKKLKSGKKQFYLNGLKLEASNINVFADKNESWDFLKNPIIKLYLYKYFPNIILCRYNYIS